MIYTKISNSGTLIRAAMAISCSLLSGYSSVCNAALYVSPMQVDSSDYKSRIDTASTLDSDAQRVLATSEVYIDRPANRQLSNQQNGDVVVGRYGDSGQFVMQQRVPVEKKSYAAGTNVPLFFAVQANVPKNQGWLIHIEDGLDKKTVTWKTDLHTWQDALNAIAKQNNLYVKINAVEKAIGYAKSAKMAQALANKVPQVFILHQGHSLKHELTQWAKRSGWDIEWDTAEYESNKIDYILKHDATFIGKFVGSGGVVDQALKAMAGADNPLKPIFHTQNTVLQIVEAGYNQEVKY